MKHSHLSISMAFNLFLLQASAANAAITFSGPYNFDTVDAPTSMVVADFDEDGSIEIGVGNTSNDGVSIMFGDGSAGFSTPISLGYFAPVNSVVVADFDKDNNIDLALTPVASLFPFVEVLYGNGLGQFPENHQIGSVFSQHPAASGDFDNNGWTDLVVPNTLFAGAFAIHLNTNGYLDVSSNYSAGSTPPRSIAARDIDLDGSLDLAIANYSANQISVVFGGGNGVFANPLPFNVGVEPVSVATGDFNGDGNPDIVVANQGGNNVAILFGIGNREFAAPQFIPVGDSPSSIAVSDFNSDGIEDIAVSNKKSNDVSFLEGVGDGSFLGAATFDVGVSPIFVVPADFNGDGVNDLAVANAGSSNISILIRTQDNDGDGISDDLDNCPTIKNFPQLNTDGDALGDICDPDDDNDGLSDDDEVTLYGTNPKKADTDSDGVSDSDEITAGTDPLVNVGAVMSIILGIIGDD